MRQCATCILMCLGLMLVSVTHGQAQPAAERLMRLSQQAQIAYQQGRSLDAVRIYLDAYRSVDADPSLLYNVAFIYERLKDSKNARQYYKQVTQSPRSTPELRLKAYERIEKLPAPRAQVPLLADQPPPVRRAAPVTAAPPVRRPAPITAAPRVVPPAPKRAPVTAPKPVANKKVAPKTAEGKRPINRRLSPEQRRREEMRRRRARRAAGQ